MNDDSLREVIVEALKVVDDPILTWEEAADEFIATLAENAYEVVRHDHQ